MRSSSFCQKSVKPTTNLRTTSACETNFSHGHHHNPQRALQGTPQALVDLYETWKAFVSKLEVCSQDILATFRCFKHLKEFTAHHNVSVVDIGVYIREFESMEIVDFEMQLINFMASSLRVSTLICGNHWKMLKVIMGPYMMGISVREI